MKRKILVLIAAFLFIVLAVLMSLQYFIYSPPVSPAAGNSPEASVAEVTSAPGTSFADTVVFPDASAA